MINRNDRRASEKNVQGSYVSYLCTCVIGPIDEFVPLNNIEHRVFSFPKIIIAIIYIDILSLLLIIFFYSFVCFPFNKLNLTQKYFFYQSQRIYKIVIHLHHRIQRLY